MTEPYENNFTLRSGSIFNKSLKRLGSTCFVDRLRLKKASNFTADQTREIWVPKKLNG